MTARRVDAGKGALGLARRHGAARSIVNAGDHIRAAIARAAAIIPAPAAPAGSHMPRANKILFRLVAVVFGVALALGGGRDRPARLALAGAPAALRPARDAPSLAAEPARLPRSRQPARRREGCRCPAHRRSRRLVHLGRGRAGAGRLSRPHAGRARSRGARSTESDAEPSDGGARKRRGRGGCSERAASTTRTRRRRSPRSRLPPTGARADCRSR